MKCEICGKLAIVNGHDGEAPHLCARCYDCQQVRAVFDGELLTLAKLERSDPEEALSLLERLFVAHTARDHDGWLRNTVRAHRAHVLTQSDRNDEALQELRLLAQDLSSASLDYIDNQLFIATILRNMGLHEEALVELDRAILCSRRIPAELAITIFAQYAAVAQEQGTDVPSAYESIFLAAAQEYGIDLGPHSMPLADRMLVAAAKRAEAQSRYLMLLEMLQRAPAERGLGLLISYAQSEPVLFFRELAHRQLEARRRSSTS